MVTHLVGSAAILVGVYLFGYALFLPVVIGVLSHLATDVPNFKRAFGG